MKQVVYLLLLTFALTNTIAAQSKDEQTIRTLIEEQRQSWNTGDKEKFMQTYWQSDSLMFIGKSGVTYGWEQTLKNYQKAYPDTAAMGKLKFSIIEVKRLSVLYFHITGKWELFRTAGNMEGHFTLLFKKVKNKWVIVADHSS